MDIASIWEAFTGSIVPSLGFFGVNFAISTIVTVKNSFKLKKVLAQRGYKLDNKKFKEVTKAQGGRSGNSVLLTPVDNVIAATKLDIAMRFKKDETIRVLEENGVLVPLTEKEKYDFLSNPTGIKAARITFEYEERKKKNAKLEKLREMRELVESTKETQELETESFDAFQNYPENEKTKRQ